MMPLLIGNIASTALGLLGGASSGQDSSKKDPFDDLIAKLQQSGSGEKTVAKADGSTVTTVDTQNGGQRIVSATSPSGQTLTEAGYVSPTVLHKFLDNLFTNLKSDGADTAVNATGAVNSAVSKLDTQLTTGAASTHGLVDSYSQLLQSSGIALPAGTNAASALRSFLAHAAPAIESGKITRTGINLRA